MNVEIKLIILRLDLPNGSSEVLLENNSIISHILPTNDVGGVLRDVLFEYLELHPEWVKFNLIDTIPTNSHIAIIYSCLIPYVIKNKKGKWYKIGDINDKDIKKLIFQSIQKMV